eukprot:gene36433-44938_t
MGTTEYYSVLAYSQVTNSGPTTINGNLGVYPSATVTGTPGVHGQEFLASPTSLA